MLGMGVFRPNVLREARARGVQGYSGGAVKKAYGAAGKKFRVRFGGLAT